MLETHIKILASLYTAILISAVVSLLLFGGFKFDTPMVKGQTIKAIMIDVSQFKNLSTKPNNQSKQPIKPIKKIKQAKPIKPKVVQQPKPIIKKDPPIIPKKEDPKPKIDTKKQEKERKETLERQKKLKEIRKKRKAVEERRKQAEQDLKDLANKSTKEDPTPNNLIIGDEKGTTAANERNQLMARYQLAVFSAVQRNWTRPTSSTKNLLCHVKVHQTPGGIVITAAISLPCNASEVEKKSILAAIHKTDPLPYKGFESVFDRKSNFIFQPD